MGRQVRLEGEALELAKVLDTERKRVLRQIDEEIKSHLAKMNALMSGWQAYMLQMMQRVSELAGTEFQRTLMDTNYADQTGIYFVTEVDAPEGDAAEPAETAAEEQQVLH